MLERFWEETVVGMIFAISPGSSGSGHDRYTAYLPFVMAPGAALVPFDAPVKNDQGSYTLRLEKLQNLYAISSGEFQSPEAAAAGLDELRASLLWVSLQHGAGVSYSRSCQDVNMFDAPIAADSGPIADVVRTKAWEATDGHYDADKAAIIPDHKRLTRWEMGRASVQVGISVANFFNSIVEARSLGVLGGVMHNDKLKLAIELCAAYRFELSDTAQFISLVSALESLLPDVNVAEYASSALLQAKSVVAGCRDAYQRDSKEWKSINHLLSRIGMLKTEAIGTTFRAYLSEVVSRNIALGNPDEVSVVLRKVYSIRSALLHDGRADELAESLSFLRDFVPRLLVVLFREAAKATPK